MNLNPDQQWIGLLSGATLNYNDPGSSEVTIEDLAAALSNVCRFSGHLPVFYSVAQHLVNTSHIVPAQFAYQALMHDTSEAFTNDIPTPLKWAVPAFKDLEARIEEAMGNRFGFEYPYHPLVKLADTQMLLLEKKYIKQDDHKWINYQDIEFEHLVDLVDLKPWQPIRAKREFLERYEELKCLAVDSIDMKVKTSAVSV